MTGLPVHTPKGESLQRPVHPCVVNRGNKVRTCTLRTTSMLWGTACLILLAFSIISSGSFLWMRMHRQQAERIIHGWDLRRDTMRNRAGFTDVRASPVPIELCPGTLARSHFAVVSMVTTDKQAKRFHHFQTSAAKLMTSIKTWSPGLNIDMLLIVAVPLEERANVDVSMLAAAGWTLCAVDPINSPPVKTSNRFLESSMFSRLIIWKLAEYKAVLSLDTDMIVARDLSPLFTMYYPEMVKQGKQLAAVRDFPLPCPETPEAWTTKTFNGGTLLITPSTQIFEHLYQSMYTANYEVEWAEQGLLNAVYPQEQYIELPSFYDAFTVKKFCNITRWEEEEKDFAVVHYTAVKGWGLEVVNLGVILDMISKHNEFNAWGCVMWNVVEYCLIWEMIPVVVPSASAMETYTHKIAQVYARKHAQQNS
jgi:hypothetical protein